MNRFEIQSFYESRQKSDAAAKTALEDIFLRLDTDKRVVPSVYKGIVTYRLK